MKTRRAAALGTAVVVAAALSACTGVSGGGGGNGGGGGGDGIRFLIPTPEDAATQDLIEQDIAAFSEESGIDVQVDTAPLEQLRTVLQTQLRSGSGPDVFRYDTGPGFAGALNEAGLLYDLTDAAANWDIYPFAQEKVTFDGKVVGIPDELETIGIFYNKDVLDDNGIAEPQSVDDLVAAAQTLKDAGVTPFAFGNQEGWEAGHVFSMALNSSLGPDGVQALIDGDSSWESPEVVDALDLVFRQFQESGFYPQSPNGINYDDMTGLFLTGQAAMAPTGTWLISDISANADFEVGFVPFPAPDGEGVFTGGLGSGLFMSANSDNTEDALELMNYLASEEHGQFEVEQLQLIPAFPVDAEGSEASELFSLVLQDTADFAAGGGSLGPNIDVNMSDDFNKAMSDGFQALLNGDATAEDVAAQLQAAAAA